MKDESTNTTLALGGQSSTTAMSLRDSEGKIHQPAQWNHKYDAEDITLFLDSSMREADTKCHQSLVQVQKEEGEGEGRGGVMPVMPGASVHVYSKEALAAVMQRNRQLMQTAFRHSHINGHKAFSCGICNKFFNQGSHLQQHIRTHTGERPYVCDVCRGTFTRMSDLKRHMRTHTGEKPYKCAACGNQFGDVSHLKSHIRTHTGEKPFQCAVCSKQFARQSSLKRHLRTHRNVDVEIS
ncbi:zinc finger protein 22 [Nilaparvata lugens]|uniref:zinc finger protein 22 n=1 Tax=Nilaparvata lugens TaxID=108931 RepID=UPI00193CE3C6|nr:zinc finger protein 22 [Nilaparvata lugens]